MDRRRIVVYIVIYIATQFVLGFLLGRIVVSPLAIRILSNVAAIAILTRLAVIEPARAEHNVGTVVIVQWLLGLGVQWLGGLPFQWDYVAQIEIGVQIGIPLLLGWGWRRLRRGRTAATGTAP